MRAFPGRFPPPDSLLVSPVASGRRSDARGQLFADRSPAASPATSPVPSPAARGGHGIQSSTPTHRVEHDVARLTTFPVPGFHASTMETSKATQRGAVRPPPASAPAASNRRGSDPSGRIIWKPDDETKVCMRCDASFNLFRRRHHCRLCGQIYCFNCCHAFVDSALSGAPGRRVRCCAYCVGSLVSAAEAKRQEQQQAAPPRSPVQPRAESHSPAHARPPPMAPIQPQLQAEAEAEVRAKSPVRAQSPAQTQSLFQAHSPTSAPSTTSAPSPAPVPSPAPASQPPQQEEDQPTSSSDELQQPHPDEHHDDSSPLPLNDTLVSSGSSLEESTELAPMPKIPVVLARAVSLPTPSPSLLSPVSAGASPSASSVETLETAEAVDPSVEDAVVVSAPTEMTSFGSFEDVSKDAASTPEVNTLPSVESLSEEFEREVLDDQPIELIDPTATVEEQPAELPILPPLFRIESSESSEFAEFADGDTNNVQAPIFRRSSLSRRRRFSAELMGSFEQISFSEVDAPATESEKRLTKRTSLAREATSFRVLPDTHTQQEIVLDKYMKAAHERIREGIQYLVDRATKHFVDDGIVVKRLLSQLEDMAFISTSPLLYSMNFRSSNGFNFSQLVHVKTIATTQENGSPRNGVKDPYSFKWLAGCVCHKQLSHKQMAKQMANPLILLFGCSISYDRAPKNSGKMSSLDALIDQEKDYMKNLVDKIASLEPDIIFVEGTVSRPAQELLRERGVAIVLNVKRKVLDRISRYTGATVITSADLVRAEDKAKLVGTCRSFYAEKLPSASDDTAPTSATTNGTKLTGQATPLLRTASSMSSRPKTESYLYLDGCDPLNGCTVLITGASKAKLKVMKKLMQNILSMTYRTLLEAHVLCDLGLDFSDWYRRSLGDIQERMTWPTTCTLRQYENSQGKLRYYQCSGSKRIGVAPYSENDLSLGNFLEKEIDALPRRCTNSKCNYTMAEHVQTFNCTTGTVTISFEEVPEEFVRNFSDLKSGGASELSIEKPGSDGAIKTAADKKKDVEDAEEEHPSIFYSKWCTECSRTILQYVELKNHAYKYSFARLLDVLFAGDEHHSFAAGGVRADSESTPVCTHNFMTSHVLFFIVGEVAARMEFAARKPIQLFNMPQFVVVNGTRRRRSGASRLPANQTEQLDLIETAAQHRLTTLTSLLEKLTEQFMEKIEHVEDVVQSFEDEDGVSTELLIKVTAVKQSVTEEYENYVARLAAIAQQESPSKRLAETDRAKRALYYTACGWIDEFQKLRRSIRKKLVNSAPGVASSPFSLSTFSFSTPTTQSPAPSPRTKASSRSTNDINFDDSERSRGSSDAVSINGTSEGNALFATTPSQQGSPRPLSKSALSTSPVDQIFKSESKESGWRSMLYDIYRTIGKSTPDEDFDLPLPADLLDGHPSLPNRSNDCAFLVNETEPITCVAYALGSQSYDDQLSAWRSAVLSSSGSSSPTREDASALTSATEWTRLALSASLGVHFKHNVSETPRHLGLLYPTSGTNSNGCWDFSTIAFFPLQFEALRELFYGSLPDYLFSISHVNNWAALGGKSGASFYRTLDDRFVVKHISSTEQQSFLEVLPSYFKYMSKSYFDEQPTVISKTVGMYQTTITKKETGQRTTHHIIVMENAFYGHSVSRTFDLKGSSRNRYVKPGADGKPRGVQLDGNFVEMTAGHPLGVIAEDHELLQSAIKNDAAFMTSINIVDFSLVVGLGGETEDMPEGYTHMTVGIIDYLRQFDLMKRVESVSKSVAMIAGQSSPTIIEPALYAKRFSDAIGRYFMPVNPIDSNRNDVHLLSYQGV